jgi:peptide deformylase
MYEGCLSVQGLRGRVRRPRRVRVQGLDRAGRPLEFVWEGLRAAVIQHETDHLEGVLFVDRADPRTLTFLKEYGRYVPIEARIVDGGAPVGPKSSE